MRMTKKFILVHLFVLLPIAIYAQISPSDLDSLRSLASKHGLSRMEAERSGKAFFLDSDIKYNSLEEASMDVDRLLEEIATERDQNKLSNESLSFRLSQRNRRNLKKDKIARDAWSNLIDKEETTVNDLVGLYAKFGNKPTYYVNGIEVDQPMLDRINPKDVISTEVKVTGTRSGNPNGEIWYQVETKTAEKIRLASYKVHNSPVMMADQNNQRGAVSYNKNNDVQTKNQIAPNNNYTNTRPTTVKPSLIVNDRDIAAGNNTVNTSANQRGAYQEMPVVSTTKSVKLVEPVTVKAYQPTNTQQEFSSASPSEDEASDDYSAENISVPRESSMGKFVQITSNRPVQTTSNPESNNTADANWVTRHYNEKEKERKQQIEADKSIQKSQQQRNDREGTKMKNEKLTIEKSQQQRNDRPSQMQATSQSQYQQPQIKDSQTPQYRPQQNNIVKEEQPSKKSVRKIKERQREKYEE